MQTLKDVSEDYVVSRFLEAEFFSPRFQDPIHRHLREHNLSDEVILQPKLDSPEQNQSRKEILNSARGYIDRRPGQLFHGFPVDVKWQQVRIQTEELGQIHMPTYHEWLKITRDTRLLSEGADYLMKADPASNPSRFVRDFIAKFDQSREYPPVIFVTDERRSRIVMIEGAVRSISYWLMRDKVSSVTGILGSSPNIAQWHDF